MERTSCLGVIAAILITFVCDCAAQPLDVAGIDHVALRVANLQRSANWYRERFGFVTLREWNGVRMIGKRSVRLGLFLVSAPRPIDDPDGTRIALDHFAFAVAADQFKLALDRLRADKVPFDPIEDTGIAWSVFLTDPDGHRVELTTYHPPGNKPPK